MAKKGVSTKTSPQWAFRSRLRRRGYGWRGSKPAIARIDEALVEIRAVARKDSALATEGAVLFLEKVSPAVRDVDSSSGALGSATYGAVEALVPIIAAAPVSDAIRAKWLDRLFEAIEEDNPPYLESLGDHWGELCVTPEFASRWADYLLPTLKRVADERKRGVLRSSDHSFKARHERSAWADGIIFAPVSRAVLASASRSRPAGSGRNRNKPPQRVWKLRGASENCRTSATGSTVGAARSARSSSRRRGSAAKPSALSTSRTAVGLSASERSLSDALIS